MSPRHTSPNSESREQLTNESAHDDGVTSDTDRVDDIPVLACENGTYGVQHLASKKSLYLKKLRFPKHKWPTRCREGVVLAMGVLMTCLALGLIVAGALRAGEHGTRSSILRVSSLIKRPLQANEAGKPTSDDVFTFDELLALSNYALNKPTQQSSVFLKVLDIPELDGESDFAVDGSISTCARTDVERNPFWYVDLGQIEHVRSIRVYGSDFSRLHDLDVYVGNSENVTDNILCSHVQGRAPSLDVRIVCNVVGLSGRYVGIIQSTTPDKPESLIICEVLIYLM